MPDDPPAEATKPSLIHRVEYAFSRGLIGLITQLPIDICASIGRFLGGLFHLLSPRYRRLLRRNLRIATCDSPLADADVECLMRETFHRAGANFFTSLRTVEMSPEEVDKFIATTNSQITIRSKESGGLVVAMPHMGNWEALAKIGGLHAGSSRYGTVYRPLANPLMDELTYRQRTADGAAAFSRKDGFHAPISLLREPGLMVVLADQRSGGRGQIIPFFGKLTSCSPLPSLMARRSKAEVCTLSICTIDNGQWRFEFHPIGYAPGTPEVMAALEVAMRRSLPDVFWFHDRWRIDAARPLSFFAKIDPEIARSASVPLRVLLTTPADATEPAKALIHAMFEARPDLHIDWLSYQPASFPDPRVVHHDWDPTTPPEQIGGLLSRIDAAHPAPLDAALLFGSELSIARAAKNAGLRAIIGLEVKGKPWTRSFSRPHSTEAWSQIAADLARIPKSNQR